MVTFFFTIEEDRKKWGDNGRVLETTRWIGTVRYYCIRSYSFFRPFFYGDGTCQVSDVFTTNITSYPGLPLMKCSIFFRFRFVMKQSLQQSSRVESLRIFCIMNLIIFNTLLAFFFYNNHLCQF